MTGKCRPSLRKKTLRNVMLSNLSVTDKECILAIFERYEAKEERHGKWELKHIGHGHYWECSVCHTNPCIYVTNNTNFCPNCGAKMDLEG